MPLGIGNSAKRLPDPGGTCIRDYIHVEDLVEDKAGIEQFSALEVYDIEVDPKRSPWSGRRPWPSRRVLYCRLSTPPTGYAIHLASASAAAVSPRPRSGRGRQPKVGG